MPTNNPNMNESYYQGDSYKIRSYVDFFDSYFESIIPWGDKDEYYRFLSRMYSVLGPLHGSIRRLSVLIARPLVLGSGATDVAIKSLNTIKTSLKLDVFTQKVVTTMFIHPHVVVAYLPPETITCKCEHCDAETQIGRSYKGTFRIIKPSKRGTKRKDESVVDKLRANPSIAKAHIKPVGEAGISYLCSSCEKMSTSTPTVTVNKTKPGILKILEPSYTSVISNPAGVEDVVFIPTKYDGIIGYGRSDLRFSDIDGVPWEMVQAYAGRGEYQMFVNSAHRVVLKFEEIVTPTGEVDLPQLLPITDDLMSVSVLKRGNEAVAVSKISPLYLVSPSDAPRTSPASQYSMVNEVAFQEFVLEQVRAHEEGDIGRIAYSPIPVNAQALFGDGRRFMVMNEIVSYMRFALGSLGVSPSVLDGTSPLSGDPISLEILAGFAKRVSLSFLPFIQGVVGRMGGIHNIDLSEDEIGSLFFEKVTDIPGTYSSQTYTNLVQNGMAPMDRVYREVGLDIPYPKVLEKIRQEHLQKMQSDMLEQNAMNSAQRTEMLRQVELQSQQGQVDTAYASQMIRDQANQIAQQMLPPMTDGERRSYFNQLMKQDYVLHAVVLQAWDDFKQSQQFQAGGGPPLPGQEQ